MATIDAKLLAEIGESTCFGLAYDEGVPECKQCDVKNQCKARSEGADIPTPTIKKPTDKKTTTSSTPKEDKGSKPPKSTTPKADKVDKPDKGGSGKGKAKTESAPNPAGMPDFKPMNLDSLKELAKVRNVEWKDYGNDSITRMRLIMALRKSYE